MSPFSANLKGFAELAKRLETIATKDATAAGQAAVRAGGVTALQAIKDAAPVSDVAEGTMETRNGREVAHHKIVNSLKVTKIKQENEHQVSVAVHSGQAYQASWVEFGSLHNAPNPFMLRGFMGASQPIIDAMSMMLNKQIIKRGGS